MGLVIELSKQFEVLEKKMTADKLTAVYDLVSLAMYYSYSTKDAFEPQFAHNCATIREIMKYAFKAVEEGK